MSLKDKSAFPDFIGADGMTLRQYYAGLAMQGLIAGQYDDSYNYEELACASIKRADALIKELEKTDGQSN